MAQKLAASAAIRAGFVSPLKELVERALKSAGATNESSCVEIGAGDGALSALLPESLRASFVHTEPCDWLLPSLARAVSGQALLADARCLPFASASVDAIVALCVLDVVAEPVRVAHELARVLRPGGAVVHLLDLGTELSLPLADLARAGWLPLPNVFSPVLQGAAFPEDLFVVSPAEVRTCQRLLGAGAVGAWLDCLSGALCGPRADGDAASELFGLVSESAARRVALRDYFSRAIRVAPDLMLEQMGRFHGRPLASSRHFQSRLDAVYAAAGFVIEVSDVWLSREPGSSDGDRLVVGHVERAREPSCQLTSAGMFVFIARR